MCIHIAASLHCTTETNTTLYRNYTSLSLFPSSVAKKRETRKQLMRSFESAYFLCVHLQSFPDYKTNMAKHKDNINKAAIALS